MYLILFFFIQIDIYVSLNYDDYDSVEIGCVFFLRNRGNTYPVLWSGGWGRGEGGGVSFTLIS